MSDTFDDDLAAAAEALERDEREADDDYDNPRDLDYLGAECSS
jgi:hypothetical protein